MPVYVSSAALDWALTHIEAFGDTDIFPVPFEYAAIRDQWVTVRDFLGRQDLFTWSIRPYRRCLSPKHNFGFRVSTQLDPLDTLIFTALVYEIGSDLEAARVPADKGIVHSYRFRPTAAGLMYDPDFSLESFRERCRKHASEKAFSHVVLADIADFYPRIYSHPLENALKTTVTKLDHAKALGKILNQWNFSVSYGIPVGPAASRLLAERAIVDVDAALLSEKFVYCRFVDDFRIFCKDERTAYESLAFLANVLFENHGLTLQQHKTRIMKREDFEKAIQRSEKEHEGKTLTQQFDELLKEIGVTSPNPYEPIDVTSLTEDQKKKVDALNLVGILKEQATSTTEIDQLITKFVLRRLGQIDDPTAVTLVLDNIVTLYPVFKDVLGYLVAVKKISAEERHKVGATLLDLIDSSTIGHLEYHRCWILNAFTRNREWNNDDRFAALYQRYSDQFTRRELIAALGRAHQEHWFKTIKRNYDQFGPWEKRAFIAAASSLPGDEGHYWYKSVFPRLDELEQAVCKWAEKNPW